MKRTWTKNLNSSTQEVNRKDGETYLRQAFMKVYFAPEIPHVVISQALATIDREIPDKEELVLVVQISSSEWFVATQLNIYFTGNYRASRHVIRDVRVMRDTGIEFFITGRYGRTIPHSAFGRAGETQEVCRRLRKAYIAYEDVPTQRVSKVAALKIASYDLESHSYWFRTILEDGKEGDETEWCADYRFTESSVFANLGLREVEVLGEIALIEQFSVEPNMDAALTRTAIDNARLQFLSVLDNIARRDPHEHTSN